MHSANLPAWTSKNENLRLSVTRAEIDSRRDGALEGMRRNGIDVAVFTSPETIFYLTGIHLPKIDYHPLILSASGNHRLLCRNIVFGWRDVWAGQTWASDWIAFRDEEEITRVAADAIREVNPKAKVRPTIGFELDRPSISYSSVLRIGELAGAASIASCTAIAEDLRVIKSPAELELMRRAGKISAKVSDIVAEAIRSGATDIEASIAAGKVLNELSGTQRTPPAVMTGALGGNGHMFGWTKMKPEPGDAVTWYLSGYVHNYTCPLERTIVRGPDKNKVLPLVEAVARAVEQLVAELRPGMTSSQAYDVAMRAHQESNVAQYWRNHAGYGAGINWIEFDLCRLRPNDERVLRPGMALHLVPCLTVPGLTMAQASRVIAITDDGVEELSDYPLRLEGFN